MNRVSLIRRAAAELGSHRRQQSPATAALREWLDGPRPTRGLVCTDALLRSSIAVAITANARRQGFQAIWVPLGPDLWRLADVVQFLDPQEKALSIEDHVRHFRECVLEERRESERPLVVVFDGLDDADPTLPLRYWAEAATPRIRFLFAAAQPLLDGLDDSPVSIDAPLRVVAAPRDPELVGLLSRTVASIGRVELKDALGRVPRADPAWITVDGEGWRLCRSERGTAQCTTSPAASRRYDRVLARAKGPYGRYAVTHLARTRAGLPRLRGRLRVSPLPEDLRTLAIDAGQVRRVALGRLREHQVEPLALAVEATLMEATARELHDRPNRRLGDVRELCLACLALADAARGDARGKLVKRALKVARSITDYDELRAELLLRTADRCQASLRRALAEESFPYLSEASFDHRLEMARYLPPRQAVALLTRLVEEVRSSDDASSLAYTLRQLPVAVSKALRARVMGLHPDFRLLPLTAIATCTREAIDVRAAFPVALEAVMDNASEIPLLWLVPHLDPEQALALVSHARRLSKDVLQGLATRLVELGVGPEQALDLGFQAKEKAWCIDTWLRRLTPDAPPFAVSWLATLEGQDLLAATQILGESLARAGLAERVLALTSDPFAEFAVARGGGLRVTARTESFLLEWALGSDPEHRLPYLAKFPQVFSWGAVVRLLSAAVQSMAGDLRRAALYGDFISLATIVPLLARPAGDRGLVAVAKAMDEVVTRVP